MRRSHHATGARPAGRRAALAVSAIVLLIVALLSLRVGSLRVTTGEAIGALVAYDPGSYEQTVVRNLRVPRTLVGMAVGAALALAGAAMQAVTRNPLAGPSILGVNSGAAFAIVLAVSDGGVTDARHFVWFAFAGGLAATLVVYALGSAGHGATPDRLALAGVIVSALLGSWMTTVLLINREALDVVRFWLAGSIAGRDLRTVVAVGPFLIAGAAGTFLFGPQLNVISLGTDLSRSLGMNVTVVRLAVTACTILLAGASVAIAGPIGFVGLAVPHAVRVLSGPDYRWIAAFCLIVGPIALLGADIVGRVIARPSEVQVGIVTAIAGAPVLIAIARRRAVGV